MMKKKILILCAGIWVLASCESTKRVFSEVSQKSGEALHSGGVVVRNDPAKVEDTAKYRALPVDERVRKIPPAIAGDLGKNLAGSLKTLVQHLSQGIDDDFLKIKNLHDWIALNISYDAANFFRKQIPDQSYAEVLRRKTSVCEGYANLFLEMCRIAGIRCVKISGYARGFGFDLFETEDIKSNHAWNAVRVGESWYLVDCTWDAGHLSGRTFQREYSTAFLFPPARNFLHTHFPEIAMWQLTEERVSPEAYRNLPYLRGGYFTAAESSDFETGPKIVTADKTSVFTVKEREGYRISGTLLDKKGTSHEGRVFFERSAGAAKIHIAFPDQGDYLLRLFARKTGESRGWSIAEIGFKSRAGTGARYPTAYTYFDDAGCGILLPAEKYLRKNTRMEVKLALPGIKKAFAVLGRDRVALEEKENGVFSATLTVPPKGYVDIFGATTLNTQSYFGILRINIVDET